jgi:hypothetical protein
LDLERIALQQQHEAMMLDCSSLRYTIDQLELVMWQLRDHARDAVATQTSTVLLTIAKFVLDWVNQYYSKVCVAREQLKGGSP